MILVIMMQQGHMSARFAWKNLDGPFERIEL